MGPLDWVSGRVFNLVHQNNLVYNTCWEDPRLDRVALELGPQDSVLVITSAGCNALDYSLTGPAEVHAVDMNPRQNAVLELKLSGIRNLEYDDFFQLFGKGRHADIRSLYQDALRDSLSPWSQAYWDRWLKFFGGKRKTFYFRGASGSFARLINIYVDRVIRVRPWVDAILNADSLEEQREIYDKHLRKKFWSKFMRFFMNRDTTLSLVGVPKAQRRQVENDYEGGVVKFVQDCVEAVFAELPLSDNYFWRVYLTGSYEPYCCPEYLKRDNFEALKGGLADRVHVHTDSVQGFLEKHDRPISRFVLLDHMDWMSDHFFPLLESEWQAILNRAAPQSRVIWRSGGLCTDWVNDVTVMLDGKMRTVGELLTYNPELAAELHAKDRVHTYGSFYIADIAA